MKPYYEHGGVTIYHGDCREVMPQLADIEAIVTDPPWPTESFYVRGNDESWELMRKGNWFIAYDHELDP